MRAFSRRADGDSVAGTEDQQPRALEFVAGDLDLAFDQIDRALLVVGIERRGRSRRERHLHIEPVGHHRHRRGCAEGLAGDHACAKAVVGHGRQAVGGVMLE